MDNIKNILNTVIGQISNRKQQDNDHVQRVWASALNIKDIKHTYVADFKNGCLVVYVDSPARLFQIKMQYRAITERLKDTIPDFQKLVLKIGKVV